MILKENFIKAFWLCFLIPFSLLSQNVQNPILSSIEYEGLKSTKVDYLQYFLDTRVGEIIDLSTLKKDIQRLQNLSSISKADFELDTVGNAVPVSYTHLTLPTIYPV